MRVLPIVALAFTVGGCCPSDDVFQSTAGGCDDSFCGEPTLIVGTGTAGYEPLADGAEVATVFGPQGGYHIDTTATMDGLCPIVRIGVVLEAVDANGDRIELFSQDQRVQAVREGAGTVQEYWGLQAFVPCEYWPDGPHDDQVNPPECPDGTGQAGHIDEMEAYLIVTATDDNDRTATGEARVQPTCCED